ncbi:MAG: DUF1156 domain-containing protein [Calditrichia bacterium]
MKLNKKLIEVALPLDAINAASAREKSIRHGHPSTLHLWWARRPLAAARAVIFAQMVDDPSAYIEDEKEQERERQRLFRLMEDLVKWENTTNDKVLEKAREEIRKSWQRTCELNREHPRAAELFNPDKLPAFHDPFAGGGALPLEAQRLGLEAWASDLNPVAVLINKAMIEIPPKFAGRPPVNPEARRSGKHELKTWKGAQGLAEDVRYYGQWMRDEAEKRIGHLYPKVEITAEMAKERPDLKPYLGKKLTVIAWLWARTVKSPNPAFADVDVPLASTFMLSTKKGKEAYIEPVIENGGYRFTVKVGKPKDPEAAKMGTKLSRGANFKCIMSGEPISGDYIKAQGQAGRIGARLMAIVAEGDRGRIYLPPVAEHEKIAKQAEPIWKPNILLPDESMTCWTKPYGIGTFGDLFTNRQLCALNTLSNLVEFGSDKITQDSKNSINNLNNTTQFDIKTYAKSITIYMSLAIDKAADYWSTACSWHSSKELIRNTFGRQVIPVVWDYAEVNPFSNSSGNITSGFDWAYKVIKEFHFQRVGYAKQADAQTQKFSYDKIVSTDPPYYNNIGYADLSDFFYLWLRKSLKETLPDLFSTVATPKAEELVATLSRHGNKNSAEKFFLEGMTRAMQRLAEQAHPSFPVTIYYAFKQSEKKENGETASTGWETFLDAVIRAGFTISGTWPMRTELGNRMIGMDTNALASSIVLVCRKSRTDSQTTTRRQFIKELRAELPRALRQLQAGNIAPVDLQQAAIGPGMAVFTRYRQVLDAAGNPLSVRDALALINQTLDEVLAEQEGDFDPDTRWALAWFEQQGFTEGEFGLAETLSKAKNTGVNGMVEAGIIAAGRGKVRLLKPQELPEDWDPQTDKRLTTWEMVHHLIRVLEKGGENAAAELVAKLGAKAETARELAYRLYNLCERKKRAREALSYNALVQSWPEIARLAGSRSGRKAGEMDDLFKENN